MSLTSIPYLLLVFFAVIVYYLVSQRMQPWVLLAVSLFFFIPPLTCVILSFLDLVFLPLILLRFRCKERRKKGKNGFGLLLGCC